jgi:hypothetical protein
MALNLRLDSGSALGNGQVAADELNETQRLAPGTMASEYVKIHPRCNEDAFFRLFDNHAC